MQGASQLFANGLVLGGAGLLYLALMPIRTLIGQLFVARLKQRWRAVGILVGVLICMSVAYAVTHWHQSRDMAGLMMSLTWFLVAAFILMMSKLALQTTLDMKKMGDNEGKQIIDPLTGTFNRQHFDSCLSQELNRARRYWLPLSIMKIDIDHLRNINNAYNQLVGDRVLAHIGQLLLQQLRITDVVSRYSDGAFVIITPHTRLPDVQDLAERLRGLIEASPITLDDGAGNGQLLKITVSIGVAALFEGVTDAASLMRLADDALLAAKTNGRNRVVMCDQVIAPPN